jgi:ABC-type transport system involved in multi-copper enzyme maturation permease subunit
MATQPALQRPIPKAPGFLASSLRVFDLSLGEMLWSRRTIFMGLLVGAPVLIALAVRFADSVISPIRNNGVLVAGPAVFGFLIWTVYLRFIVPVLGIFYGTSLIADEVEDKTITYLFTRPIPKGAVLVGKYLAYLACTILVVLPSVVIVYLSIVPMRGSLGASFMDLVKDLLLLALGLVVYGAVFAFVGARFKRPLLIGLVFAFGWEQAAMLMPGYLRKFTVVNYLQGMVPHAMPNDSMVSMIQGVFREIPSMTENLVMLGLILVVFLWLAAVSVERKEYVLDQ